MYLMLNAQCPLLLRNASASVSVTPPPQFVRWPPTVTGGLGVRSGLQLTYAAAGWQGVDFGVGVAFGLHTLPGTLTHGVGMLHGAPLGKMHGVGVGLGVALGPVHSTVNAALLLTATI